ncbi:MAG: ABC transporter substrate-binding protein [Candidatus Methanomethyliaceae archaeon]
MITACRKNLGVVTCVALLAAAVLFSTLVLAQGSGLTIIEVRGTDVWTLDPHNDTQATSRSLFHNIFDPLVRINWNDIGNPLPALAVSWEWLSNTAIRFHLRQDAKWHDGRVFGAEDVKFTFDRVLNKAKPTKVSAILGDVIEGVTVEDPYTIVLHLTRPYAPILSRLSNIFIIPKETFLKMGEQAYGLSPIGTGAYIVDKWEIGQYIRLVANESWWGWVNREKRPDVVIRKSAPEDFTRFALLKAGEADIVDQIPPELVHELQATPGLRAETSPSLRVFFVGMNAWRPPFDNVLVRRAMNYAIDPQLIVDTILLGQATVHTGVCPVGSFGYCQGCRGYSYNPALAKELLKEAGYPTGFKVTLWSPRGKYMKDLETAEAIAGQLKEIGIDVEIYAPAWPEYWDNFLAGNMDLFFLSCGISFPDCDDAIAYHLDSTRRGIYYHSLASDLLIQKEQEAMDPAERAKIFEALGRYFIEEAPWIFLWDQNLIYGVSSKIKKFTALPVEDVFYWDLEVR